MGRFITNWRGCTRRWARKRKRRMNSRFPRRSIANRTISWKNRRNAWVQSQNPPKTHSMNYLLILFLAFHSVSGSACAGCERLAGFQLPAQADAFQRGLTALKENRLDDALAEFTAAEHENPENALIRNFRGILLVQLGKNPQAAPEYQEAI